MSVINELISEYVRMRENGLESKATLHALRPYIDPLPEKDKAKLAENIRKWEAGDFAQATGTKIPKDEVTQMNITPLSDESDSVVKPIKAKSPIKPLKKSDRPGEDLLPEGLKPGATWIACPSCGTKNKTNEIFCYACGQMIHIGKGLQSTRNFAEADTETFSPEFFGKDSLLILRIRESGAFFKLRPQNYTHELVIGRSSSNTAMKPDVDLADESADEFGVSRLHLAVQYIMEDSTLIIFDLGSANGSFINGQKLHPSEKRILRHKDELRLGRMVIIAEYEHPGQELD